MIWCPLSKWGDKGSEKYKAVNRAYAKARYATPEGRAYKKTWDAENRAQVYSTYAKRAAESRRLIAEAKSKPCLDCGVSYPPHVMDLDHVRGQKTFNLGSGRSLGSPTRIVEEIAKCDAVCANCHREREHRRRMARKLQIE
jgi:hypothetical protein